MRAPRVALLLCAAIASAASAQNTAPGPIPVQQAGSEVPFAVRWGKWGAAALFLGFTAAGLVEHQAADNDFEALRQFCITSGACQIGSDGRYLDARAEQRYATVVHGDRVARAMFISGQVALAGAAALFVVELMKEKGTRNIPYSGLLVAPSRDGLRVGWRFTVGSP